MDAAGNIFVFVPPKYLTPTAILMFVCACMTTRRIGNKMAPTLVTVAAFATLAIAASSSIHSSSSSPIHSWKGGLYG